MEGNTIVVDAAWIYKRHGTATAALVRLEYHPGMVFFARFATFDSRVQLPARAAA
jgi:hypothetical protein